MPNLNGPVRRTRRPQLRSACAIAMLLGGGPAALMAQEVGQYQEYGDSSYGGGEQDNLYHDYAVRQQDKGDGAG